jgi:hypothetical protein
VRKRQIPDVPQGIFTCEHLDSRVLFQKGRILVQIEETVRDPADIVKDPIIDWLSRVLSTGRAEELPIPLRSIAPPGRG